MKIGILYICTGKYTVFWDEFYHSCEKHFMPNDERHYFVFTDGEISTFNNPNVNKIHQNKLGWPYDTLMRFKMFITSEDKLMQMDYLFFFNANLVVKKNIGHEILPATSEEIIATIHPKFYKQAKSPSTYPYDRNPDSHAYIPLDKGQYYVQGAFNGGTATNFLKMSKSLNDLIEDDLSRNVIALWHDESHLNKYIIDKNVKILHSGYIYPEKWRLPLEMFMMSRKKDRYGKIENLRGIQDEEKDKKNKYSFFRKIFRRK